MKTIDLDATSWKTPIDFYDALAAGLGSPDWHGRGIDPFLDTMVWHDDINGVAPPYTIMIHGSDRAPDSVRAEVQAMRDAIISHRSKHRAMYDGRDVDVSIETVS